MTSPRFTPEQEEAIRGIRAAFPPRRVMASSMRPISDHAVVKANGERWLVSADGTILPLRSF